jgi:hypothetical protein
VVVCGGSHVAFDRTVSGARIINVGSVGEAPQGSGPADRLGFASAGAPLPADAFLIEVGTPGEAGTTVQIERLWVPLGKAA